MKIRQDVTDLLHTGLSDREIAAQLHVDAKTVAATRAALGLPKARPGKKPAATLHDAFHAHVRNGRDGHMRWTSPVQANGTAVFRWQGRQWTAYRAAFEIRHGHPPVGKTLPACGKPKCVAPAHMQDQNGRTGSARTAAEAKAAAAAKRTVPRTVIASMLTAGHSIAEILRTHKVSQDRVRAVRNDLGIPPHPPGAKPEPIEQTFRRRAIPTEDGHLVWPTTDYHIKTVEGGSISATRYAFQQRHGRPPVGKVLPGCGIARCVHPDHVEDRPMREALTSQLNLIFGSAA
ncbi:hypothetical protein R1T08_17135 [Streptomyces sp. SBC-4]|nr:hypothetical protein [Streptomyces sp. SBC-4]MDV5145885.1 hypothetical protein [Streptomyces sp. SBC-4]